MTSADITAVCTAVGLVLGQVAAVILAVKGIQRSKENGAKLDTNKATIDAQAAKIDEIHAQTGVLTEVSGLHKILKE